MVPQIERPVLTQVTVPLVTAQDRLSDILTAHRGERHIIVLHAYPDPDAISAAYAHQLISAQCHIETDIVYCGVISHSQNIALTHLLNLHLTPYDDTLDFTGYAGAIYVDHQGGTCSTITTALEKAKVPTLIVVDHHETHGRLQPAFSDIRRVGATATIYTEYLEGGLLKLDHANPEHVAVATALMHGIMSDTNHLVQAGPEDFRAASYLSQFSDANLLNQIMSQSRSASTLDIIRRALTNRINVHHFSIAGVGYLRSEDRDAIPQSADFLLSEEDVHTAIVYGIVTDDNGDEKLIGSLRTSQFVIDPDQFIKDLVGKDTAGWYLGGGKAAAAGFQIPIGFLAGPGQDNYADLKWELFDAQLKRKLLAKLEAEHKSS